jgi:hypothetical protein
MTLSVLSPVPKSEGPAMSGPAKCGQCGVAFDAHAWGRLELVEIVARERLQEHVTSWPSGTRIEVRRCPCGRALARKVAGVAC